MTEEKGKNIWNRIWKNPETQILQFNLKPHVLWLITQTSGPFFEAAYNKFKTQNTTVSYNGTEEFLRGNYLKECLKKWYQENADDLYAFHSYSICDPAELIRKRHVTVAEKERIMW